MLSRFLWSMIVAASVLLGLVAALIAIFGAADSVQMLVVVCVVLIVLLLLKIASPRSAGFALSNIVKLELAERGKHANSNSKVIYVPLRSGISHQIWFASYSATEKVTCKLDGAQVNVNDVDKDGTCFVNFGRQLRLFRRYTIHRQTKYKESQFSSESEFFYFRPQAPTLQLVIQIAFPSDAKVSSVIRSVRIGIDELDRGTALVENNIVKWVIWFPTVGNEYWIRWTWE